MLPVAGAAMCDSSPNPAADSIAQDLPAHPAPRWTELHAVDLPMAAHLLALAMLDNPTHRVVFGTTAGLRERRLLHFFLAVLPWIARKRALIGILRGNSLVGVAGSMPPGACRPGALDALRALPALLRGIPPAAAARMLHWLMAWRSMDARSPHWHIGPLAVHPEWQRHGFGTALLRSCCETADRSGQASYLETDLERNVRFYQHHGFQVAAQRRVLGVQHWFLERPASTRPGVATPCA